MQKIMDSMKDPKVIARLTREKKADEAEDRALQRKRTLANTKPRLNKVFVGVHRAVVEMRHTTRHR